MSPLSIILLFSIKNLSEVGEKYAQIKQCLQMKTVQNRSKQICLLILMWEDNRGWTFYRGSIVMDYELVFWPEAIKLKGINEGFVSYKHAAFHFTRHQLMDWSLVDYLCMFLSAVWSKLKKTLFWLNFALIWTALVQSLTPRIVSFHHILSLNHYISKCTSIIINMCNSVRTFVCCVFIESRASSLRQLSERLSSCPIP